MFSVLYSGFIFRDINNRVRINLQKLEKISCPLAIKIQLIEQYFFRELIQVCQNVKEKLHKTFEFLNLKRLLYFGEVNSAHPQRDYRLTYVLFYSPFSTLFPISFLVLHQVLVCHSLPYFFKWLNTFLDKMVGNYLWNVAEKNSWSLWLVAEGLTLITLSACLSPRSSVQCQVRQSMQGPWLNLKRALPHTAGGQQEQSPWPWVILIISLQV